MCTPTAVVHNLYTHSISDLPALAGACSCLYAQSSTMLLTLPGSHNNTLCAQVTVVERGVQSKEGVGGVAASARC